MSMCEMLLGYLVFGALQRSSSLLQYEWERDYANSDY